MRPTQRVITEIPMRELWDERGPVVVRRARDLSADDIRELLRRRSVRFVVADVGFPPRWIPEEGRFSFWKSEVRSHVAAPGVRAMPDDFPGGYVYFAAEWTPDIGSAIILLEKYH